MPIFIDTSSGDLKFGNSNGNNVTLLKDSQDTIQHEIPIVLGSQTTSFDTYTRIGTIRINSSSYSISSVSFEVHFETSDAANTASIRLYNVTDATIVASSTFTTTSGSTSIQSAAITLASGQKDYEVQLKLATTDTNEVATCTRASLILNLTQLGK